VRCVDLFAGLGGFSEGARMAGHSVVWAANHWQQAVDIHAQNHPETQHACQDLHQANWALVPRFDLLLASPCCQGHSKARGKASGNPQHDASRSTAWAVVSACEFHRPAAFVVENVPDFVRWSLYPAWRLAMESLGYCLTPMVLDTADSGVPQNRVRLYIVGVRASRPILLKLPQREHVPASSFIDFGAGSWSTIARPGRSTATLNRIANGRAVYGDRFVAPYYGTGSGQTGRSLDRPIGTITTRDRWSVIDGDRMRMLNKDECRSAMSFPPSFILPQQHQLAVHMLGNAVAPVQASDVIQALEAAL
jgi:DNA (cytosine-5)-methyltransferase 1